MPTIWRRVVPRGCESRDSKRPLVVFGGHSTARRQATLSHTTAAKRTHVHSAGAALSPFASNSAPLRTVSPLASRCDRLTVAVFVLRAHRWRRGAHDVNSVGPFLRNGTICLSCIGRERLQWREVMPSMNCSHNGSDNSARRQAHPCETEPTPSLISTHACSVAATAHSCFQLNTSSLQS